MHILHHDVCLEKWGQKKHQKNAFQSTKCCASAEICTSRFTKYCACQEICTSRFTKCCTCSRNLHFEVHKVLRLPRNLHLEVTECCACHEICKRAVQKSRFTAPVTKSELLDDHHRVQSAAPATKTTCHEKSTLENQKTRFPLCLPQKSHHHVRKCARHHNESAVVRSTRRRHSDLASHVQSKCTSRIFGRHECTVYSSESAAQARAAQ